MKYGLALLLLCTAVCVAAEYVSMEFATPIYTREENGPLMRENNKVLKNLIMRMMKEDQEQHGDDMVKISNMGGYQGRHNFLNGNHPAIVKLRNYLYRNLADYLREMAPGGASGKYTMSISSSWVNVNKRGDLNSPHVHTNCIISGAYYVDDGHSARETSDTSESGGRIQWFDPRAGAGIGIHIPPAWFANQGQKKSLKPLAGMLAMWPSYLMHWVTPHKGKKPRISIAFNAEILFPDHNPDVGRSAAGNLKYSFKPDAHAMTMRDELPDDALPGPSVSRDQRQLESEL